MYTELGGKEASRIVNNSAGAGLRSGGRDRAVRGWLERQLAEFRPDVVHVQHLAWLDHEFSASAPLVWTLPDAWGWCAAGGTLLRDGRACPGPGSDCARCAQGWAKDGPLVDAALAAAGLASRIAAPERLHAAWRHVPAGIRARVGGHAGAISQAQVEARTAGFRTFAHRCAARLAPSRWLADEAARQGFGPVEVLETGIAPVPGRAASTRASGPFVFLGTIAPHKGPDLVLEAHRRSGVVTPLLIHGPPGPDPGFVARVPNLGPVADPMPLLARARALVLGSIWPENAPLVVLEARAAGCPVIAPSIGGLPEWVQPGVDGWLYPAGAVDSLARCIIEANSHPSPPVRPPRSLDEHVDGLERVYDRVR